jgi:TetR/AcrR family transcriptional regulator
MRDSVTAYVDEDLPVRFSGTLVEQWEELIRAGQADGELVQADPIHLMHLLGAGNIFFAATGSVIGQRRRYDPSDKANLEAYRTLLHRIARAVLPANDSKPSKSPAQLRKR